MNTVKNFDDAWAEEGDEQIPIQAFGEVWYLPASPPAEGMMLARRMEMRVAQAMLEFDKAKETRDLAAVKAISRDIEDNSDIFQMMRLVVGDEIVDAWVEKKMSEKQAKSLFRWIWRTYNGLDPDAPEKAEGEDEDEEGDAAGEAQAPNREQRRAIAKTSSKTSSNAGRSSKPISKGNIKSTSEPLSA